MQGARNLVPQTSQGHYTVTMATGRLYTGLGSVEEVHSVLWCRLTIGVSFQRTPDLNFEGGAEINSVIKKGILHAEREGQIQKQKCLAECDQMESASFLFYLRYSKKEGLEIYLLL